MGELKQRVDRRPLAVFYGLAVAISWLVWAPLLISDQGWWDIKVSRYFHLAGAQGPLLAAFIVTALAGGRPGLGDLCRRMTRWNVGHFWYAVVLAPALFFLAGAVVERAIEGSWPDFGTFGRSEEFPHLPLLGYWLANVLFYGFGEEVGWRGFALPHLQRTHSAWRATVLLWIAWAVWHIPLFGLGEGLGELGAIGIPGWLFSLLLGAVLLTWIYNGTGGSIWMVALFHGILDISINAPDASAALVNTMGALITVWGFIVFNRYGPERLSMKPKATRAVPGPSG